MNIRKKGPWYKVQYQLLGHKEVQTRNLIVSGRTEVMNHLQKSEGVTTDRCNFLYVHEHRSNGDVAVVLEYESEGWSRNKVSSAPKTNLPVVIGGPNRPPSQIKVTEARVVAMKHA